MDWVFGVTWVSDRHLVTGSRDQSVALWSIPEPSFGAAAVQYKRPGEAGPSGLQRKFEVGAARPAGQRTGNRDGAPVRRRAFGDAVLRVGRGRWQARGRGRRVELRTRGLVYTVQWQEGLAAQPWSSLVTDGQALRHPSAALIKPAAFSANLLAQKLRHSPGWPWGSDARQQQMCQWCRMPRPRPGRSLLLCVALLQGKVRDVKYDAASCRLAALSTEGCVKMLDVSRDLRTVRSVRCRSGASRAVAVGMHDAPTAAPVAVRPPVQPSKACSAAGPRARLRGGPTAA